MSEPHSPSVAHEQRGVPAGFAARTAGSCQPAPGFERASGGSAAGTGTDAQLLFSELQTQLRRLVQALFNGDLFHQRIKGVVRFGAISGTHVRGLRFLFDRVSGGCGDGNAWFQTALNDGCARKWLRVPDLLNILRAGYDALAAFADQVAVPTVARAICCRPAADGRHGEAALAHMERIRSAAEPITPQLGGLCIHGSLATNDYTDFSDTDDLVILKHQVFNDPDEAWRVIESLRRMSCGFYRFDPYQHHRHIIASEFDLQFYSEAFLPLDTLRRAVWLMGDAELTVRCRPSRWDAQCELGRVIDWFRRQWQHGRPGAASAWHAKYYIATVLLVPVLVLQSLDRPMYKGESFREARELFSVDEWLAVEMAAELRAAWSKRLPWWQSAVRWPVLRVLRAPLLHEQLMRRVGVPRELAAICHCVNGDRFQKSVEKFVEAAARIHAAASSPRALEVLGA